MPDKLDPLETCLTAIYGNEKGEQTFKEISARLTAFQANHSLSTPSPLNQKDTVLITYGDQFQKPGQTHLKSLTLFCHKYLKDIISSVHILPFFPYSSDDGFSVIDYLEVDPALGKWEDIQSLAQSFRLMVDVVINHISSQSVWFQEFIKGTPKYQEYFITANPQTDLSAVVRPRTLPLLTPYDTVQGQKYLWTTFSADQIDLNFANPDVLLEMIDILLAYIAHGAQMIRLDAIAYLWKQPGTACIHLPQTHWIIQIMRSILDRIAPYVFLITETNVPHRENVSYFGDGYNEAQMVYNFTLPPLVLHSFHTGSARQLSTWASGLTLPSQKVTFFNFLASHDGIGVNPVRGILSETEINNLVERTLEHGGLVSYKSNSDGSQSPYELNINYFDALSNPYAPEPLSIQIDRFICAQAILLSMVGIPGIYVHSLLGSRSWLEGAHLTGRNRTINRQKFEVQAIESQLADCKSQHAQVFQRYAALLRARASQRAFHPHGAQVFLDTGNEAIFAVLRIPPEMTPPVICLHNVSDANRTAVIDFKNLELSTHAWFDLVASKTYPRSKIAKISLSPYQVVWLTPEKEP